MFVERCATVVAGASLLPRAAAAAAMSASPESVVAGGEVMRRLSTLGLELYSVRREMRTDPERTLKAVAEMGYRDVELLWSFGNFGRSPQQVREALANAGLRATSAHMGPATILVGWERSLETASFLGHQTLVVPSLAVETQRSLADWREWADKFNRAGELARSAGIWLMMHNEPDHQRLLEGRVPFEVFAESIDPRYVRLQLDVGNMTMGGGDPLAFLAKYGDRCWSFHVKDIVSDRSRDTELGKGTVDLRKILSAISDVERKTFFVEQEGSSDALASARQDFEYLSRLEF